MRYLLLLLALLSALCAASQVPLLQPRIANFCPSVKSLVANPATLKKASAFCSSYLSISTIIRNVTTTSTATTTSTIARTIETLTLEAEPVTKTSIHLENVVQTLISTVVVLEHTTPKETITLATGTATVIASVATTTTTTSVPNSSPTITVLVTSLTTEIGTTTTTLAFTCPSAITSESNDAGSSLHPPAPWATYESVKLTSACRCLSMTTPSTVSTRSITRLIRSTSVRNFTGVVTSTPTVLLTVTSTKMLLVQKKKTRTSTITASTRTSILDIVATIYETSTTDFLHTATTPASTITKTLVSTTTNYASTATVTPYFYIQSPNGSYFSQHSGETGWYFSSSPPTFSYNISPDSGALQSSSGDQLCVNPDEAHRALFLQPDACWFGTRGLPQCSLATNGSQALTCDLGGLPVSFLQDASGQVFASVSALTEPNSKLAGAAAKLKAAPVDCHTT